MDLKELERLFKLCRKYDISYISAEGYQLNFHEKKMPSVAQPQAPETKTEPEPQYSEEDMLYWSSAGPVAGSNS